MLRHSSILVTEKIYTHFKESALVKIDKASDGYQKNIFITDLQKV